MIETKRVIIVGICYFKSSCAVFGKTNSVISQIVSVLVNIRFSSNKKPLQFYSGFVFILDISETLVPVEGFCSISYLMNERLY